MNGAEEGGTVPQSVSANAPLGLRADSAASEDDLVTAAGRGDQGAFAALYDRYLDRIYRHCYWRCGSRADAEDLTQQTFLKAWSAVPRYEGRGVPFVTWLLAICHNEIIAYYRKYCPTKELGPELFECLEDPEAVLMDRLALDAIRHAVGRLEPLRQQVIVLRYLEGLSISEVAAAVGRSENYVSVIQHRALSDVRRLLLTEGPSQEWAFPSRRIRHSLLSTLQRLATPAVRDSGEP